MRDDFNQPTRKSQLLVGDETTTASEQSSVIMSDSDIESNLGHEQAKQVRDRKITWVFVMLFVTMAVARTDQGIVPALATTLKKVFGFNNAQIGQLGSSVYIGAVFGKSPDSFKLFR